ncbi:hypothetical protein EMIHUDRAFT_210419 [Emiliania huxleyi CCMP1516]|uniref:Uncharacterized protein n=2 Tax=Emiliania huxleyi TaxID=2903 RepID=A0A0D3IZZ9_EMIH1|nr:hypothetical protein EMIHUDRAFT_210419 [Emiliania huxleyi CCMP1516]EOD16834.1 hypothetical protein EMIHUDRAFT_210419 [Emiliania huxleyi CCMP1516]|eukprot:XP_005769263.1 hypothetical protein EMIHUDRAFT_210419 [Emiliania huxleyi CCMP1516]
MTSPPSTSRPRGGHAASGWNGIYLASELLLATVEALPASGEDGVGRILEQEAQAIGRGGWGGGLSLTVLCEALGCRIGVVEYREGKYGPAHVQSQLDKGQAKPSDGGGYVAYKKADYAHALSRSDTDVQMYLFETFGGWCNAVKRLFYQMKDKVRNKLSKRQHEDEASWSTRSWLSLQAQRMSVALQLAAAEEIATELRLAAASEDAAVA